MISPLSRTLRRACASVLATVLLVLSVLVPLLDRGERSGRAAFESEHDAATCVRGHDHTVCTQFGSNHHILNEPPRHGTVSHEAVSRGRLSNQVALATGSRTLHQSRAPPLG